MSADVVHVSSSEGWLRSLADTLQLGAAGFGVVVLVSLLLLFGLWELAFDRFAQARLPGDPQGILDDARVAVSHVLCAAYLMAALVHAQRVGETSLAQVRPLLRGGPDVDGRLGSGDRWPLRAAVFAGVLAWLGATALSPGEVYLDPRHWTAEVAWHRGLGLCLGILGFRLSTLLIVQSTRISRLAAHIRRIDLLDPAGLQPFVRQGLSNALLILGFAAVFSLFLVDLRYLPLMLALALGSAGVAGVALLLPLLGVRRRIQETKRAELAWCRARMRESRQALDSGDLAAAPLAELTAWERRIAEVREWPLDPGSLVRFGLYLAIPLVSWSGGALVERLLDAWLG